MNWLEYLDQEVLLAINRGHLPWLDTFFWYVSKSWFPLGFYALTFILLIKQYRPKRALLFLGIILVNLALTDIISTQVFKEGVKRYRPSHHLVLGPQLHLYEESPGVYYKGGQYGFFSSHAANYAGFFFFVLALLWDTEKKWMITLGCLGILICYSRMYLGVHYPSDILAGILFGGMVGWTAQWFAKKFMNP